MEVGGRRGGQALPRRGKTAVRNAIRTCGRGKTPPRNAIRACGRGKTPPRNAIRTCGRGKTPPRNAIRACGRGKTPPRNAIRTCGRGKTPPRPARRPEPSRDGGRLQDRARRTDRGADQVDSLSFIPPKKGKRVDRSNAVSPFKYVVVNYHIFSFSITYQVHTPLIVKRGSLGSLQSRGSIAEQSIQQC